MQSPRRKIQKVRLKPSRDYFCFKKLCTNEDASIRLVPAHVVIPHPETNAAEKKAALERRKILEGTYKAILFHCTI